MKFIELSSADKEKYNRFVAASPSGSFLQSWDWGGWQESLGRQILRYKILDDNGVQLGCVQLIKMPLFGKKYYWYSPYGPVGVENYELLASALKSELVGAVFIRVEPKDTSLLTNHYPLLIKSPNIQPAKTLLVDLTKPEQQLLGEMHTKTRYNIKVAQKHGVEIKEEFEISNGHGLFVKEAVNMIAKTAERQGFKGYGVAYYNRLIDYLAVSNRGDLKLHIYKAIFASQILASAIMLDFSAEGGSASGGGTRVFLFGGSSDEHKNVMAPYLMHWQAMQDAKAAGFLYYDFWGIETSSGEVPGFVRFKLGFGGNEKQYAGAYDIVCDRLWYKLYGYGRKINRVLKKVYARA